MKVVIETSMRGHKAAIFQNQPVHEFHNNLQAVLKEVFPEKQLQNLFAKPFSEGARIAEASKLQWLVNSSDKPVSLLSAPEETKISAAKCLQEALANLKTYSEQRAGASGTQKQYANFLSSIPLSPSLDNVFVVDEMPVIVFWGFAPDTSYSSKFMGWDQLNQNLELLLTNQLPTPAVLPPVAIPEPARAEQNSTETETINDSEKPNKKESGGCAKKIVLLLLILLPLLLLFKSCQPPQKSQVVLVGTQSTEMQERSIKSKILVNLNWNLAKLDAKTEKKPTREIDLDLGCLIEMKDGELGCIQALSGPERRGAFNTEPYILYRGDDRSGKRLEGEILEINGNHFASFKRILIFALIYRGADNWNEVDAVLTMDYGIDRLKVPLSSISSTDSIFAVALIENVGNTLKVTSINKCFQGHQALDNAFKWGISWGRASKDD
mgnify:CR=1 FL=1